MHQSHFFLSGHPTGQQTLLSALLMKVCIFSYTETEFDVYVNERVR